MRLVVEIEGGPAPRELPGGGDALVALMSFAVVRGFGAQHPLIALADRLHDTFRVPLGPLTTFYDATVEDVEDREKLELAWQPAADLLGSLEGLTAALTNDPQSAALVARSGATTLPGQAAALLAITREAAASRARMRLSYVL
ncbi:MAG: hypothetical protein IT303_19910 [Dehalococcoidia bacterium]|nr:hypothetical protein [Dehalococcoidia bacterium]